MVHTPHQEMIQQEFFELNALRPAVGSEDFTHGAAFFQGLNGSCGGSQFAQDIVVEMAVPLLEGISRKLLPLGQYLTANIVNTSHILPRKAAEIVTQAAAGAAVLVVILDEVADVLHAMLPAPVSKLEGKIFPHGFRHGIHIVIADSR